MSVTKKCTGQNIDDPKITLRCVVLSTHGFGVGEGHDITLCITKDVLGSGKYGHVHRCQIPGSPDTVVKVFLGTGTTKDWPGTIESEILGLGATRLQYILCHVNSRYYLVLRNYGKNIRKIWDDKHPYNGFSLPYFLSLLRGVYQALMRLHMEDFVHADVKGSNIVILGHEVTLIDFGLCHHIESDFCTKPYASEQLTPGAQYGLAYHKVCDPRALLVVIFHLVLKCTPCCEHSVTKHGTVYRFQIVAENLPSHVHDILGKWPNLQDAVSAAHAEVANFDKISLQAIETATCNDELADKLKTLSEDYYSTFTGCIESIISTSATIASSSHDATSAISTNSVSSVSSDSSDSSLSSARSESSVSADSSNSSA